MDYFDLRFLIHDLTNQYYENNNSDRSLSEYLAQELLKVVNISFKE